MNKPEIIYQICQTQVAFLISPEMLKRLMLSGELLAQRVAEITLRNLASGRAQRVIKNLFPAATPIHRSVPVSDLLSLGETPYEEEGPEPQQLAAYINRIIETYLKEYQRVERLANKDNQEWETLLKQLSFRTYQALLRRQIAPLKARGEAEEFAHETCQAIYSHIFPYDVPFDAWATKILNNIILHRYTRSRDLIDRNEQAVTSLDYFDDLPEGANQASPHDFLMDQMSHAAFEQVETQEWLLQQVLSLRSQAQQQVILLTYFYDLSDEEIADKLRKTKNAVQILRHRGLARLSTILRGKARDGSL